MPVVGQSVKRIDAEAKVRGEAKYPGDFNMPGQLYMKVLFSDRAHAIIRRIDTTAAEQSQGVIAVFTAKDVPVNEYGLLTADQPVLCGPGSTIQFADHVRTISDNLAVVVAESEEQAAQALHLIKVEYEDLPIICDPRIAMKNDAALLHPETGSNIFCHYRIRKGDVEKAFSEADVIVENIYQTPSQEHAYLQPEAGICYFDEENRITVVVAGQWAHEDQEQIAHALNLPKDRIRVIYPAIGGAFGGREDMSVQIILALAVYRLDQRGIRRSIKIVWNREESFIGHHKRHPYYIKTRWAAKKDGKVTAVEAELIADGGGYIYTSPKVLGNSIVMCTGPYEIPNVKADAYAVYTNNIPTGAFRGFGGPQAAFSAENQMNKLAEILHMDPVEIRMRNVLHDGQLLSVGTPLPKGVSIPEVVEHCGLAAGWKKGRNGWEGPKLLLSDELKRQHIKQGIGFACSFKNVGFSFGAPELSVATVELRGHEQIEKAIVYHAGADVGQGAHTIFAQAAAEVLNLPMECIELVVSDTARTQNSGSASASRMTFMAGNSIKGAAQEALEKWNNEERPAIATCYYRPPKTTPLDPETGKSEPNFSYGYVAEAVFAQVDTETGQITLKKVICADDVGHAVNPAQVSGQIEGAIVQAEGYAILEDFIQENGQVKTRGLSTYLIPTILDIPEEVESVILEYPDPIGPWGARGMAEMPFLPLAPAITAALHQATGVWFNQFPLTPERVLEGLLGQNK
jgi:CO/xanthine dehydrogenase Mo-binding subunit